MDTMALASFSRRVGLMQKTILLAFDREHTLWHMVEAHNLVLKEGLNFAKKCAKLENSGTSAAQRETMDPKHAALIALVKNRTAFMKTVQNLAVAVERHCPQQDDMAEEGAPANEELRIKMRILSKINLAWKSPSAQCFDTWLYSETVMDSISHACVKHAGKLEKVEADARERMPAEVRAWRQGLPENPDVQKIREHGKDTIMKIPDKKAVKSFMDHFSQALSNPEESPSLLL